MESAAQASAADAASEPAGLAGKCSVEGGDASGAVRDGASLGVRIKLCICVAVVGGFIYGYDLGVLVGILPDIVDDFRLSSWQEGFVVGLASWGGILGALLGGYIADAHGRRTCMMVQSVSFIIGAALQAGGGDVVTFGFGRVVTGIGFSLSTLSNLAWISEIVPARVRGRCVSVYELSVTVGVFVAFVVNKFDFHWRWAIAASGMFAAVQATLLALVPESPVWFLIHGMPDHAERVFAYLRCSVAHADECKHLASAATIATVDTCGEFVEGPTAHSREVARTGGMLYIVRRWFVPFVVVMVIQALGLLTGGVNIRVYAISIIRDDFGVSESSADTIGVVLGVLKVAFTLCAVLTLDKFGRKRFYIVGMAIMFLANAMIATASLHNGCQGDSDCAKMADNTTAIPDCTVCPALCGECPTWSTWLVVSGIGLGYAAYQLSFGPVNFALGSEMFPPAVRARFLGTQYVAQAVFQLLTTTLFPVMWHDVGLWFAAVLQMAFCVGGVAFVVYGMVETSGRVPTDILHLLNERWGRVEESPVSPGDVTPPGETSTAAPGFAAAGSPAC